MAKRKGPAPDLERERFWRSVVEGWSASGLSIREWCRRRQVSEPSFYAWRRELNRRTTRRTGVNSVAPLLLPITIEPSHTTTPAAPLVIELPGVVRVHVRSACDAVLLATVCRTWHRVGLSASRESSEACYPGWSQAASNPPSLEDRTLDPLAAELPPPGNSLDATA